MHDEQPISAGPYGPLSQVIVDRARFRLTRMLSRNVADQLVASIRDHRDPSHAHRFADVLSIDFETELLTERLPPDVIRHRVKYEHPEAIGRQGVAADARFARPIDHFTAKYRGRWWGRLLGLRRREVRYEFVAVPYIVSAPVQCDHEVTATVRAAWTYPRATLVLPGSDFGHPVLRAGLVDAESRPRGAWGDRTDEFSDMVKRSGL